MKPEARPLARVIEHLAAGRPVADPERALADLRVEAVARLASLVHGMSDGIDAIPCDMPCDASDAMRALRPLAARGPEAWIAAYEALSAARPVVRDGRLQLERSRQARRRRGGWYTPPAVVEAALDHALDPLLAAADTADALLALRICDPACGAGRFLLGAARRLAHRLCALTGEPPAEALPRVVARCLHGADLDRGALALARLALEHAAGRPVPSLAAHLIAGDALAGPVGDLRPPAPAPDAIDWCHHAPDGFDLVVGNPPYRAGRLAALDPARLRPVVPTAEYQLDPYALFLDRAARLARRRMALLVPTTWMSNHRARALRSWLLGCHRLDALIELPPDAFDATVETAIPVFAVGAGPTAGAVPVLDLRGAPIGAAHADPDRPEAPLPLTRDRRAAAILRAARRWTRTLGDVAEVTRGINPYHRLTHRPEEIAARVHHADHPVTPEWSPELRGRDLPAPYRLDWKGDHWIHYGPWLKEPRAPRFFEGPRLLVRKILGETLCAVYVEHPAYCDQSVYIARLAADCPYPPHALLACVNSRPIAALLRARHQTHRAAFPQLKVGDLRALPLPPAPPGDPRWQPLAAAAEAMQRSPDATLRDAIEARVAALYGIDGIDAVDGMG